LFCFLKVKVSWKILETKQKGLNDCRDANFLNLNQEKTIIFGPSYFVKALKVSKSEKHFFLKFHCPKMNDISTYLTKFCPSFIGQNFAKYLVCFLDNGVSRKNAFEIY
jgi:hypothetical protein